MNSSDSVASQIFSFITEAQNIPLFLQHALADSKEPESVLNDISQVIMTRYETVQDTNAKARLGEWISEIDRLRAKYRGAVSSNTKNSSAEAAALVAASLAPSPSPKIDRPVQSPSIAKFQPYKSERARSRSRTRRSPSRSRSRSHRRERSRSRSISPKRSSKHSKRKYHSRSRTPSPRRHSRSRSRSRSRDRKRSDASSPKRSKKSYHSDIPSKNSQSSSSTPAKSSSGSRDSEASLTLPSPSSVTSTALQKVINQINEMRQKKGNRFGGLTPSIYEKSILLVQQLAAIEQESLRHFNIIRNTTESLKKKADETQAQNESGIRTIAQAISSLESVDSGRLESVQRLLFMLQKNIQKLRSQRESWDQEPDRAISLTESGLLAAHSDLSALPPSSRLFVSSVPRETKAGLLSIFESFGKVSSIVHMPKWSMAFVNMDSSQAAEDAVDFFRAQDGLHVTFANGKIDQRALDGIIEASREN